MNILLLKSLKCTIRITQCRVPHVSMGAMQSTPRPAADEAFPDIQLMACNLHCSGATVAWYAMLIMLHGVTVRFRNSMPSLRASCTEGVHITVL